MKPFCLILLCLSLGWPVLAAEEAPLTVVQADMQGGIKSALEQYKIDCGHYPLTSEGGWAVVIGHTTNAPVGWRGPYLEGIPKDPWGHDWDEYGELFFVNTVNGQLWHGITGAHFDRPHTLDPNPHVYGLIDQHADHYHFDTGKGWQASRLSVKAIRSPSVAPRLS